MPELLVELLSEEIPARMQARACADLERLMAEKLKEARLDFTGMEAYATPRRLALVVNGLPERQPDRREERRGPRVDAPEKALRGFRRSLPAGAALEERDTPKGRFLYAVIAHEGRTAAAVIADIMREILSRFPWPKSMRWGEGSLRWVRPLQSILCLLDGAPVDFAIDGVGSGNTTRGHRFMAPATVRVTGFDDYKEKLKKAKVILDPGARRGRIEARAGKLAREAGLELVSDPAMIDENAGLTEWPFPLLGHFDPAFLEVPEEVLVSAMRHHQKYLTLKDPATGRLAPAFICVANTQAPDGGRAIVAGNERVLGARLADARFFWEQDLKVPLEERLPALADIVFHDKLGSMAERVARIETLAAHIAERYVKDAPAGQVRRAARLAKADLVTGTVGEFPELQGVIGARLAAAQGEPEPVARAIEAQYAPKGPDDLCPDEPVAVTLALAEKLDTLVGFFAIGETPTGSKDPFALRRAALGAIRLIIENGLRIALLPLFETTARLYRTRNGGDGFSPTDLLAFFAERLKVQQRARGVRHDLIDAVFALGGEDDLVRLLRRVEALADFVATEDGAHLLAGYKRAANIVKIEEKRDRTRYDGMAVDPERLVAPGEKRLHAALNAAREAARTALAHEDFAGAMRALAALRAPIDAFFDAVTVNAEDAELRRNRLALLAEIRAAVNMVADFSRIEG